MWAHAIYHRQRKRYSATTTTRRYMYRDTQMIEEETTGTGRVKRWEWGFGKGQWYRQVKKLAKENGIPRTKCRRIYFLIGSYYSFEWSGPLVKAYHDAI